MFRNTLRCTQVAVRALALRRPATGLLPSAAAAEARRTFTIAATLRQDVNVVFIRANGEQIKAKGKVGDSLLDVVVNNSIDLDGFGACEGTLTCSTCHLILKPQDYEKLPDKPGDEELDMLDLAYDLTDTSRLGCQITLTKDMDGLEVHVPATINDARSA